MGGPHATASDIWGSSADHSNTREVIRSSLLMAFAGQGCTCVKSTYHDLLRFITAEKGR